MVLSNNNYENLSSGDGGPLCGREWSVGYNGDEGEQQHPGDEDWGVEHGAGLGLEHQPQSQSGGGHVYCVRRALRGGQVGIYKTHTFKIILILS